MSAQTPAEIQKAVDAAYAKYRTLKEGKNADYIAALAKVDPNLFGIAVVTADGKVYTAGDVKTEVSIQSISKVFTVAQVIQEQGLGSVPGLLAVMAPPACMTTPASACTTPGSRPRAAAASSPCRRASSASPSSRRRSTMQAPA